jgi:hypothetical protein
VPSDFRAEEQLTEPLELGLYQRIPAQFHVDLAILIGLCGDFANQRVQRLGLLLVVMHFFGDGQRMLCGPVSLPLHFKQVLLGLP